MPFSKQVSALLALDHPQALSMDGRRFLGVYSRPAPSLNPGQAAADSK